MIQNIVLPVWKWAGVAQSVWKFAMGWAVQVSTARFSRTVLRHIQPPVNRYWAFSRSKAPGACSWPPTPSNAEVKQRVEIYLVSPSGPSWTVLGWTLPFWKLLAYTCQIEILETLACLMLTLKAENLLPFNAPRQQMPSTVISIYSLDVRSRLLRSCWTCTLTNEQLKKWKI